MKITRAGVDRSSTYQPEEVAEITVGFNAWDGQVGQGTVPCPDPAGNQEPTEGQQLKLEQGATTILDGFVGQVQTARGTATIGVRRVHSATIGDDNALLQGHATPGWARPAEAPATRWAAFVARFLPSSIDTTWLLTTHESGVTLPKKTYRTDSLFDDLLADTVAPTGKTVYMENRRFHWHLPTEGQTCSLTIHDTTYNLSTSFPPISAQRQKDGMDRRNRIYARNDAGVVVSVSDATSITAADAAGLKHEGFSEYGADSSADMTRDIGVTLAERKDERVTWTYDIGPLTAAQAAALIVGSQMTVTVGLHGLSGAVKRIASVKLTYRHPGQFMASIELGYPKRFRRKPTKTDSSHDSTGGSGVAGSGGGGGDCGCPPFSGSRCCIEFNIPTAGMGANTLSTGAAWVADSGVTVSGGEASIPTANDPYFPIVLSQPYEILMKCRIERGTTGGDAAATGHDVFAVVTFLHGTITGLGVDYIYAGFQMDHSGPNTADLMLRMQWSGASIAETVIASSYSGSVWLRFRVEEDPAAPGPTGSSLIMSKAWVDGAAEPVGWLLTSTAAYVHSGVGGPWSPTSLLVLDNRTGAAATIWHVEELCVTEGLACGDPSVGQSVGWIKIGQGDGSTTAFKTPDDYQPSSLEMRIGSHPVNVTESAAGEGTLGFVPRSFESVWAKYRKG